MLLNNCASVILILNCFTRYAFNRSILMILKVVDLTQEL